ncbi:inovirus Gp2 family protein [Neptuniibacter sp. QD29_5]|uniref:inovirus Gp2 family protein n=1 Tax=Neptuniibacter sp. QD29_5 TaxID=3398207 RepID=UPI0039F4CB66
MRNRRVPGNHNLTFWNESQYAGFPLNSNNLLVREYLEKLDLVTTRSIHDFPRTLAVLIELHCDIPTPELSTSNRVLQKFKEALDSRVISYLKRQAAKGRRIHNAKVRWVWAREQNNSHVPHFHVLLFFNKEVFHRLGDYAPGSRSLLAMIREAWYSALGIPHNQSPGLVHIPDNATYTLQPSDQYVSRSALFKRASYLCKAYTKRFGNGIQCFGGSTS